MSLQPADTQFLTRLSRSHVYLDSDIIVTPFKEFTNHVYHVPNEYQSL